MEVPELAPLFPHLDARHPLFFMRRGQGVAGVGEALRLTFRGASRMTDAAAAWRRVAESATVDDAVRVRGSGLIALGSFAFADDSADDSVLVVPRVVFGRRDGVSWITTVDDASAPAPEPLGEKPMLTLQPGAQSREGYLAAVATAVERIRAGELDKVVLARDLTGTLPEGSDIRGVIEALALGYPDCVTYAVDGLIGSTPETLVRVADGEVSARVLAGSAARGADPAADQDAAGTLATSDKDLDEHSYALRSVLAALRSHTRHLATTELPFTLKLPNLWHLASDVEGLLADGSSSLDLAAALHPTAAVAGSPTDAAVALLARLEPFDRGRYAGPVGWIGADGDGEWAIALRCAQVRGASVTAYAGAGIVAESVPDAELAETRMKFRPMIEAFD